MSLKNCKVLIVDDDKLVAWSLSRDLRSDGCEVSVVKDGKSALPQYIQFNPDIVLLDLRLPDIDGLQVLKLFQKEAPGAAVVLMTAYATVKTAVKAIQIGAADYIKKPFSYEEIRSVINRVIRTNSLSQEVSDTRRRMKEKYGITNLLGESKCMQEVFSMIRKVAHNGVTTVLVTGESGTGKDLVAKAIHYESDRSQHPFMALNCGSMPETLLESELFGHEKGAFTDAKSAKKGLLELTDKGTLLLDEIGDSSLSLQVKLLRFLEDKTFKRIGGVKDIEVDVRVIAATNRRLEQLTQTGEFREDLYYRLNVVPIRLAPLRDRTEDIPILAKYFMGRFNKELSKTVVEIRPRAMRILKNYSWPGNVRELRNVIERVMILENTDVIGPEHLPMELLVPAREGGMDAVSLPASGIALNSVEKELIEQALQRTQGNQSGAANLLHISRHTLRYKMKKYQLYG